MKKSCVVMGTIFAFLCSMGSQSEAQDEICACIHKTNGKMRQVSDASQCQNTEIFLCWNAGQWPFAGEVCPDGSFVKGFDTDGTILCAPLCEDQDDDNYCGQTWWGILADCDDNDATVNPGAEEVCNDFIDNDCDGLTDDEESACAISTKKVFVTSDTYQGDLGGVQGADAKCQACAEAAGLPGIYRAWISTRTTECPDQTFAKWDGAYVLVDDTIIGYSWTDLTDGTLVHPIDTDEYGYKVQESYVWTGTDVEGRLPSGQTSGGCYRYTKSSWNYRSTRGSTSSNDSGWTNLQGLTSCNSYNRLYCFEQ